MTHIKLLLATISCFAMTIDMAIASQPHSFVPVPEPGAFSLIAVGAAAAAIAYRIRKKK